MIEAIQVIRFIWINPKRGIEKKNDFDQNISLNENFIESVPTVLIMIFMMMHAFGRNIFNQYLLNTYMAWSNPLLYIR